MKLIALLLTSSPSQGRVIPERPHGLYWFLFQHGANANHSAGFTSRLSAGRSNKTVTRLKECSPNVNLAPYIPDLKNGVLRRIMISTILLATSLSASAGRYENHRQYKIDVPVGSQILNYEFSKPVSIAPSCHLHHCSVHVLYQKSGMSTHTMKIGRDQNNYCVVEINETAHWLSNAPSLHRTPDCHGSYHFDSNRGLEKMSFFGYGYTITSDDE